MDDGPVLSPRHHVLSSPHHAREADINSSHERHVSLSSGGSIMHVPTRPEASLQARDTSRRINMDAPHHHQQHRHIANNYQKADEMKLDPDNYYRLINFTIYDYLGRPSPLEDMTRKKLRARGRVKPDDPESQEPGGFI